MKLIAFLMLAGAYLILGLTFAWVATTFLLRSVGQ